MSDKCSFLTAAFDHCLMYIFFVFLSSLSQLAPLFTLKKSPLSSTVCLFQAIQMVHSPHNPPSSLYFMSQKNKTDSQCFASAQTRIFNTMDWCLTSMWSCWEDKKKINWMPERNQSNLDIMHSHKCEHVNKKKNPNNQKNFTPIANSPCGLESHREMWLILSQKESSGLILTDDHA